VLTIARLIVPSKFRASVGISGGADAGGAGVSLGGGAEFSQSSQVSAFEMVPRLAVTEIAQLHFRLSLEKLSCFPSIPDDDCDYYHPCCRWST